ncbi:MAG: MFS transporter [Prevotella sp.]|nr:MFS transporter [Prevotella sp.]MCI6402775.1 MFS transporter [Prevotella sp.]MCI6804696.1 MFS transporter [Prevotella sp.]MCI7270102.1 MFS transporter [Prevotella sp.]MCI7496537.1 MFS transporter [Prevotella sp.]
MSSIKTNKMTNWRWVMCAMLFFATTINYMDRQVLSLTWKDFISPEFDWNDDIYGTITAAFSFFYLVANIFAGKFVDFVGTKKGYFWSIVVWSIGAVMHAFCGIFTLQVIGATGVMVATVSMYAFLVCRCILAAGEAGNFPAAIKVTAEYFPKKDRAFATSIFNSGASVGALAAPMTIPILAKVTSWEMAFIIIGALGFIWAAVWIFVYDKPSQSKFVNEAELNYMNSDEEEETAADAADEKPMSYAKALSFKQTWSFAFGKFMTDGVWWFFLFWAPAYFSDQYGYRSDSSMGIALIFTLYAIVTVLSMFGGYLPKLFVEKKGMNPYQGRMLAMFIFALFPVLALFAQPLGQYSAWWPAIIIGLVGAGHQAWSANIYSTVSDMFPKSAVATITGIGAAAGGLGSMLINKGSGMLFTYAEAEGEAFTFMGFDGKPAGYMIIFCICAVAYLIGWVVMKALVPKYKLVVID